MKIRYAKESSRSVIPQRMSPGAAGCDLHSRMDVMIPPGATRMVPTGIFLEIPDGMAGLITGRSSLSAKGLFVPVGTVDSDYRGEINVLVHNSNHVCYTVERNQRVAQLLVTLVERVEFVECRHEDLSHTERGRGGFGSTGEQ